MFIVVIRNICSYDDLCHFSLFVSFLLDRHVLSDAAKLSISPHHERLVEALCASGYVNHPDQPQFFPKVKVLE